MTETPIHKREFAKLVEKFNPFFPGIEIYKLYAYNTENSLLCYNMLSNPFD